MKKVEKISLYNFSRFHFQTFCLSIILLVAWVFSAQAQSDFVIRNYHSFVKLKVDGSFEVQEVITVYFNEPKHGIKRDIPLRYKVDPKVSGQLPDRWFNHVLFIKDISIKGAPIKVSYMGTGVQLKIGDPDRLVEKEVVYDIRYTIENGILHGERQTEFYWNLIGTQWEVPIEEASFAVEIPSGITVGEKDFEITTGTYGQKNEFSSAQWDGQILKGRSLVALGNGQGMTIAIRMPKGSIQAYPIYKIWFYHTKFLILPLLMLVCFLVIWRKYGWDRSMADMVAYLPPKGIDSALAGFALDIKAQRRDALSIIPYLGSQGYLEVDLREKDHFWESDQITFKKLKNLPADAPSHQKLFFDGLFEKGSSVELKDLKNEFYTTLAATQSSISEAIMHSGHFTPTSKRFYWNSFWVIPVAGLINCVWSFMGGHLIFLGLTVLLCILLMFGAYLLLKRSDEGDMLFREVRGLKKFIELAEKDRIEFLVKEDPNYFDKLLPYAIAFDCADTWCKKFEGLQQEPPRWFHSNYSSRFYSNGYFNASAFNNSFSSSLSEMRTVMSSSPSSSGSSSGGGGGSFSGGGFGGGGGSSW